MRAAELIMLLFFFGAISCGPAQSPQTTTPQNNFAKSRSGQDQEPIPPKSWILITDRDRMDQTPEVFLSKTGEVDDGTVKGVLVIRCLRHKTELSIITEEVVDNGSVRIKFDDGPPQRQTWNESTNHQGLFAPDAIHLARQLTTTASFLFEYRAFQGGRRTIEFKVVWLDEKLVAVADSCNWAKIDHERADAKARNKRATERARLREAKIRETLLKFVEPCREQWLRVKGRWCWYDANDAYFKTGGSPKETREAALEDAVSLAQTGRVFVRELEQIDHEIK